MTSAAHFALAIFACSCLSLTAQTALQEAPHDLVKDVVYNEHQDHLRHSYWLYRVEKTTAQQSMLAEEVETRTGRVYRLVARNGNPLDGRQQREEDDRLRTLLGDHGEQQKLQHQYNEDERHIGDMMELLPDAFLYRFEGAEGDTVRLSFMPNPSFVPPTYEARVFHAMAGSVWIDLRERRLVRLQGKLVSDVTFGYGLLGRIDKGGVFAMERGEVAPGSWKTRVLDVHITGHVILLKCVGKDQREVRSDFRPVSANLSLGEAKMLLDRTAASIHTDNTRAALR